MKNITLLHRLVILGLLVASLFCYLEWGQDNSSFLFQAELAVFTAGSKSLSSVVHPFILLPLAGQLLLLIALLQRNPSRRLAVIGVILLNVLILLIFLIGILSFNLKILFSTLPFLLLSVFYIFFYKKVKPAIMQG